MATAAINTTVTKTTASITTVAKNPTPPNPPFSLFPKTLQKPHPTSLCCSKNNPISDFFAPHKKPINQDSIFTNENDKDSIFITSHKKPTSQDSVFINENDKDSIFITSHKKPINQDSIFINENDKDSVFNTSHKKPINQDSIFINENDKDSIFSTSHKKPTTQDSIFINESNKDSIFIDDKPREECGVVGIYGDSEASRLCYLALHALQHRGQEGAGIVSVNDAVLHSITGVGLVSEVFNESKLDKLPGDIAIGHVRYSTAGASMLKNVQPFVAGYKFGSVGVAHNGNLVNYESLRSELEDNGSIFNTSSDTEVVLHLIATSKARPFYLRILEACEKLEGAYSMVFSTEDQLVAVRDPFGFRPLVMGRRSNGAIVFASETCALDLIEATYEREVYPGEVVVVDKSGVNSLCLLPKQEPKSCIFEHIYFSLPNSVVFGRSVYESRRAFGEILATEAAVDCDVVIAVPDSGVVAAVGYAEKAGVPFQQGLIRSHYVGRTFIEPSQKIRDFGVKLKLSPVRAVLENKRVVVVDDSIVRGTTSSKIVRMIKEAGAKEVHMRIASPPIIASCYYGVDTPCKEELISNRMSVEEIRKYIGSDSLAFLPLDSLHRLMGKDSSNFCYACFSGKYPVLPQGEVRKVGDSVDDGLTGILESVNGVAKLKEELKF